MFHSFQLKGSGLYIAGSGSISEDHPVKMSEAITERLRLQLLPGRGNSFKGMCTEIAAIMQQEPGTRAVYAGPYEENKDAAEVLVCSSRSTSILTLGVFHILRSASEIYIADYLWCSVGQSGES